MQSRSWQRDLIPIGIALVLAVGCEDSTQPDPPGDGGGETGTADIGPDGGVLRSGDGVLTLTIPAGALGNTERITIESVSPDETHEAFDGVPIARAYELGPDGLTFDVPVTVSLTTEQQSLQNDGRLRGVPELLYTVDDAGEVEPLTDAMLEIDGNANTVIVSGRLSHFSPLIQVTDFEGNAPHVAIYVEHPGDHPEGIPFVLDLSIQTDARSRATGAVRFYDCTPSDSPVIYEGPVPNVIGTLEAETAQFEDVLVSWYVCEEPGPATIEFKVEFDGIGSTDMPQMPESLLFRLEIRCDDAPIDPTTLVIPSPVARPEGVDDIDCEDCDGCEVCDDDKTLLPRVTVAGSDGVAVVDLPSGDVVAHPIAAENFGSVYFRRPEGSPPSKGEDDKGLFAFGPTGAGMTFYSPTYGEFGWFQITAFSQNVTDGTNVDGRSTSGAVAVSNFSLGRVEFIEVDVATNLWASTTVIESGTLPPSGGGVVSAIARTPAGLRSGAIGEDILVVTEGGGGSPGQLHRASRATGGVTFVGDLGMAPRRIRYAGDIAAVSNWESDALTIVRWVPGGSCEIMGTLAVGDGPVGIDLLELPNGNVAIASVGFNDDTYTITVVDPSGQQVSTASVALPDGCEGPGHVAFLEGATTYLIVTCNLTDNLVLIPLDL